MNVERMQLKGMLAEAKKKFRTLDTEASGLIILIRSLLNPYEEILKLDMAKVVVLTKRLSKTAEEMKELQEKTSKLEAELE
jgi:hypothetical protein